MAANQEEEMDDPEPEQPHQQQNFIQGILGEIHLTIDRMVGVKVKAKGLTSVILVGAGSYAIYKIVTRPELLRIFAPAMASGPKRFVSGLCEASILVDIVAEDGREAIEFLKSLESGDLLRNLNEEFKRMHKEEITFGSIDLVEVKLLKTTKDFKTLKEEADDALDLLTKRNVDLDPVGPEIIFCNVEVEKVLGVPRSHERPGRFIKVTSAKKKEVTLNGLPQSFSCSEAKRLLQEILDDDSAVVKVRYSNNSDGSINPLVVIAELRTPQLVENLLGDSSAQAQIKEAFHRKTAAMEKTKNEFYEARISGVPEDLDLREAQNLLQNIVDEKSLVTDVNYSKNLDGSLKKSTIVALIAIPKQPPVKAFDGDELWFVKTIFRKQRFENYYRARTCQKQMLLVKQSKEMIRNLEEDLYVIDVAKA